MIGAGADGGLDPQLEHLLHSWMPHQRWYPAKGRGVSLRRVGGWAAPSPRDGVEVLVHVVALDSGDRVDVVQVPLVARRDRSTDAGLGQLDGPDGRWHLHDGPHDPAYVAALLADLELAPGAQRPYPAAGSRVLSGEQSNTSVVVGAGGPDASIVKVFRTLHPGANPDVEVVAALAGVGCDRVARPVGWASAGWSGADGEPARGHVAVAVEFLAGSQDAWREAVRIAGEGHDFRSEAGELGAATAQVHLAMAQAFGTTEASAASGEQLVAGMVRRVEWALAAAPALAPHHDALHHHVRRLGELRDLPDTQRVHGDYHLGQVLHAGDRGWILLDFEGEPLRPLAERTVPDLALRDVAGMLRSFDYAEHQGGASGSGWAQAARSAFTAGYARAGGRDPGLQPALLAALELDKALYEVVYETRNRPDWLPVPVAAVQRLLAAS